MPKTRSMPPLPPSPPLCWITAKPGIPYFQTETGQPWHPIGQNDAISWHQLNPLFRRRDLPAVEAYLQHLADHGVTCMRLMLEYAQGRHRYFEPTPGTWSPNMVRLWDDLFALAERFGLRILLTPFDTFWMWHSFKHHPYSRQRGGALDRPSRMLLCQETRQAIKARLTFAAQRWGGSGALFAWDLWNEIHPAHGEMSAEPFMEFIEDLSQHLRTVEQQHFGRTHLQTVSLFGPELKHKPHMRMEHAIFRHPALDFATIHIYETGTIDYPRNTVDAAIGMGRIVRESLAEITDQRPFLDSEHGPIHSFKDRHITFPEPFDDEYFRHMQWAHLASGGAAGGMRWPNRHPHSLTAGMRLAQRAMARFLPTLDWLRFNRVNVTDELQVFTETAALSPATLARFACATPCQAVVYLLRRDIISPAGMLDRTAPPLAVSLKLPTLAPGRFQVTAWDTVNGIPLESSFQDLTPGTTLRIASLTGDLALAIQRVP